MTMSLISVLIALAAERHLTSQYWQFRYYYQHYFAWFTRFTSKDLLCSNPFAIMAFVALPTLAVYLLTIFIDHTVIYFIVSTLILMVCFGCIQSRETYRKFLHAAFRGERANCDQYQQSLAQDKNLSLDSIGDILILLNYRYYIAIMLFFVLFGPAGAVFYRLLVTVVEKRGANDIILSDEVSGNCANLLHMIDWLPARITAFGYMLVGHFSRAFPVWLETLSNINQSTFEVLIKVAKQAEDFMVDEEDCTAEPCLLVRLAKRNLMLFLAILSLFTITGVVN
jgi:AmpE protein